ncbi:SRPBCC domain-containing protein [Asticcacaulis sp. DXS10W]|uniref:SRPBCC domain-containing protein n=1 Tax=Asticcacaulis currens TaxID=2984210 RepID=A0ABT5IDT0_9CAUL|nr:SRPBCC domain-containing protein [Asticcacaulis currens]MDC7694340.1 SRPBCC domain-containing protein [Asticcacaulis currens]
MTEANTIVVDEVFPHEAGVIWEALTSGELMARWMMPATGFQAVVGNRFTFKTTPAGEWDGTIQCQILEIVPLARFTYSWKGGDERNTGYGSKLDTIVTWTLSAGEGGTRVRLVHSGFSLPKNEVALKNMGDGWKKVLPRLSATASEIRGAE